jgi:integrase
MGVYRPKYRDPKTGKLVEGSIWWYRFQFAGRHIRESSKSTRKTIALEAEKNRHRELENSFNEVEDKRAERVRSVADLVTEFLEAYKLRNPRSYTSAHYALWHVKRILGKRMAVDLSPAVVKEYQTGRLREKAAPKTINEEVGKLFQILGERGEFIRAKLRRDKSAKLSSRGQVSRAFTVEEKEKLLAAAKARRSPTIYPALMLALHAGMRDAEIRGLTWARLDLQRAIVTVGEAKTEAGEGRTIPLNSDVLAALVEHSKWFLKKFGTTNPALYVFPFGKPQPTDPTRPVVTFKTAWATVKKAAGVTGRWHDNRHTFITDLAESGEASDETIRDMAGHVSKQMLKHYSHIRMEAKRRAVDSLVKRAPAVDLAHVSIEGVKEVVKVGVVN